MQTPSHIYEEVLKEGFAVVENIFSDKEINNIVTTIEQVDDSRPAFRKTKDVFAIRQFFKEVPEAAPVVFNNTFTSLITSIFGGGYFVAKSIYFDKPAGSNWFVSYHQDLTISVDKKTEQEGFDFWTVKQNQFAVQPPLKILQDNFTVRIHLDDTNEENGALKVIPKSHCKKVYRPETIDWLHEEEHICTVSKGGVMFMKPLLLHASGRTTNNNKRRVIHIEFSKSILPGQLQWAEYFEYNAIQ
jgi:ectoine hydroxylase-related dioxygenase (phytanoyl-CoA dioxygenase family)